MARISISQKPIYVAKRNERKKKMKRVCLQPLFAAMDDTEADARKKSVRRQDSARTTAIDRHMGGYKAVVGMNGIKRIQLCRQGLDALDRRGWDRSFHQRQFHEV